MQLTVKINRIKIRKKNSNINKRNSSAMYTFFLNITFKKVNYDKNFCCLAYNNLNKIKCLKFLLC